MNPEKLQSHRAKSRPADLEIGEPKLGLPSAGLETCVTT